MKEMCLVKITDKNNLYYNKIGLLVRTFDYNYKVKFSSSKFYFYSYSQFEFICNEPQYNFYKFGSFDYSCCYWCGHKIKNLNVLNILLYYCPKCLR